LRVLLDTSVLIIAMQAPERLSKKALAAIENASVREVSAQALSEGIPVVTPDRSFKKYRGLNVIW